jgi:hypothetical protein
LSDIAEKYAAFYNDSRAAYRNATIERLEMDWYGYKVERANR